jgi:DNA-binding MarR family transcriptional regulator
MRGKPDTEDFIELRDWLNYSLFNMKHLAQILYTGVDARMKRYGINMAELALLKSIRYNDVSSDENARLSEIQKNLYVTKAAVSKMLGALESKGYLNRDINERNRRELIVTLTDKGKEVVGIFEKNMDDALLEIIRYLGRDETERFIESLERFADATAEVMKSPRASS